MTDRVRPAALVPARRDATGVDDEVATLRALHQVTPQLVRAERAVSVCAIATRAARDVLGYRLSGIHVEREGRLEPVAMTEEALAFVDEVPTFEAPEAPPRRAYERDEALAVGDESGEFSSLDPDAFPVECGLFLPLQGHGVFLIATTDDRALTRAERSFARTLAANTEAALDLVERERELQRQNDRLETFAATLSHDLRNPLSYLRGSLDLAAETGDEAYFEAMEEAIDRMDALVEDVLVLVRGGDVEDPDWHDLWAVAGEAWEEVPTGDASLAFEQAGRTWIRADRSRLRQLLANLFRNSVEHGSTDPDSEARRDAVEHGSTNPRSDAPEDPVERGASPTRVTLGVDEETLYVADDGPGIPPEERDRVFECGYTTDESGTGLGLPIVAEIARSHGWETRVSESAKGGARIELVGADIRTDPAP